MRLMTSPAMTGASVLTSAPKRAPLTFFGFGAWARRLRSAAFFFSTAASTFLSNEPLPVERERDPLALRRGARERLRVFGDLLFVMISDKLADREGRGLCSL